MRHIEQTIAAVPKLDVGPELAGGIALAADDYTLGHVLRERLMRERTSNAARGDPLTDLATRDCIDRMIDTGEFPHLRTAGEHAADHDVPTDEFEQGLQWTLDGFEQTIKQERTTRL